MPTPFLNDDPCDCPDARAFRALMASPVGEGIERLASTLAVWKLRDLSHSLSTAGDWTRAHPKGRDAYEHPARSAEEIRREVARSWAEFDQGRGPLHEHHS